MHAMVGAAITDDETLDVMRKKEAKSMEAFRTGTATKQDWDIVNAASRIAESMADAGIGPEVMVHAKIAEMHLLEARDRFRKIGKIGTTGLGLQSFKELLEYHELQRTSVPRNVYERHIQRVTNMIISKSPKIIFL